MSTLATPYNIQSYAAALAECLEYGDRLHIGVVGGHSGDNFYFVGFMDDGSINVCVGNPNGKLIEPHLMWGDIVELWPVDEKPNPYHSDVPEVAKVLACIKVAIQICVMDNNAPGVRHLLNEIVDAKRAEPLFKEAREVLAGIRV